MLIRRGFNFRLDLRYRISSGGVMLCGERKKKSSCDSHASVLQNWGDIIWKKRWGRKICWDIAVLPVVVVVCHLHQRPQASAAKANFPGLLVYSDMFGAKLKGLYQQGHHDELSGTRCVALLSFLAGVSKSVKNLVVHHQIGKVFFIFYFIFIFLNLFTSASKLSTKGWVRV